MSVRSRDLRWKQAAEHSPDPISHKAFLSEFRQGQKTGADYAEHRSPERNVPREITEAEDKVDGAARDLVELARRIGAIISRGALEINETRLAPKISGILSTLFYNAGKLRGLKRGATDDHL